MGSLCIEFSLMGSEGAKIETQGKVSGFWNQKEDHSLKTLLKRTVVGNYSWNAIVASYPKYLEVRSTYCKEHKDSPLCVLCQHEFFIASREKAQKHLTGLCWGPWHHTTLKTLSWFINLPYPLPLLLLQSTRGLPAKTQLKIDCICSPSAISGWCGWVIDLRSRWRARNLFFPGLRLSWLKTDVPSILIWCL